MSSLEPGQETNAGLTFKLLKEAGRRANLTLYYEAGIQWRDWKSTLDVMMGRGINRQIERAYGVLASRGLSTSGKDVNVAKLESARQQPLAVEGPHVRCADEIQRTTHPGGCSFRAHHQC